MSKQKQKFDQILTSYFSEDYEKNAARNLRIIRS